MSEAAELDAYVDAIVAASILDIPGLGGAPVTFLPEKSTSARFELSNNSCILLVLDRRSKCPSSK